MKTIYKYRLETDNEFTIELPRGAKILKVGVQDQNVYIWAQVDPTMPTQQCKFYCFGTGYPIPDNVSTPMAVSAGIPIYLGTVFLGQFVWHYYFEQSASVSLMR